MIYTESEARKINLRESEANFSCQRLPIQPQRNHQMLIHYVRDTPNHILNLLLLLYHLSCKDQYLGLRLRHLKQQNGLILFLNCIKSFGSDIIPL